MDIKRYILWCSFLIVVTICIICGISIVTAKYIGHHMTSSPVEEMYHRQLVVTIDSILDARFGDGCCNKLVDKDTIDIARELCSFENIADIKQ